jgi:hypothetical protein
MCLGQTRNSFWCLKAALVQLTADDVHRTQRDVLMNVTRLDTPVILGQNAHHLIDTAIENDQELIENVEMEGGRDNLPLTEPFFSVGREQTVTEPRPEEVIVLGLVLCSLRQQHGFDVFGTGHIEGEEVEKSDI